MPSIARIISEGRKAHLRSLPLQSSSIPMPPKYHSEGSHPPMSIAHQDFGSNNTLIIGSKVFPDSLLPSRQCSRLHFPFPPSSPELLPPAIIPARQHLRVTRLKLGTQVWHPAIILARQHIRLHRPTLRLARVSSPSFPSSTSAPFRPASSLSSLPSLSSHTISSAVSRELVVESAAVLPQG